MANNEFREKLRELFWKYEKKQLRKVDALVEAFQGEEETVIKHLYRRYRITYHGPVLGGGAAPAAQVTEEAPAAEETEVAVEETVEEPVAEETPAQEEVVTEDNGEDGEEEVTEEAEEEREEE